MKEIIIMICIYFFSFFSSCSQSGIDNECNSHLDSIFKVLELKIKYEKVQYIYNEYEKENSFLFYSNYVFLNEYFKFITGSLYNFEEQKDYISNDDHNKMIKEKKDKYIEHLNCTPDQALKAYKDLIKKIKIEKKIYLRCINIELKKNDLSKYAKGTLLQYEFYHSLHSVISPFYMSSKIEYLKVFKKRIIINDEEILPVHRY